MTKNLVNQWLLYGLLVMACWTTPSPITAFDQPSPSDYTHLQKLLSTDDVRHLLMRTGFGARAADVVKLQGLSRQRAINRIIDGISTEPDLPMPDWVSRPLPLYHARQDMEPEERAIFNKQRDAELVQLREWWILNILQTSSPQTERMVLFWHDLFATDYRSLGKQSLAMARQNQTFRMRGFGSWELLIKTMIRDAALLEFLDAGSNHKASPNENLARELMELFVLGEGNYDEAAVREAARSLTGYATSRSHDLQFQLKTGSQDRADKQLFGQTGAFDADDLVELLLLQDAAPKFLATRFWYAFVSDIAPEPTWVNDQALQFRRSEFDIATLYRNVLQSEAFWHDDNRGAMIKSPVDIVAGTARTLDYPISQWSRMPQWQRIIGMNLFAPPNVSGWAEGVAFITPGHLLNRYKVVQQMLNRAAKENNESHLNKSMTSLDEQEKNGKRDDMRKTMLEEHANNMMQSGDSMQASSSLHSLDTDGQSGTNDQGRDSLQNPAQQKMLKGSNIHMLRGIANTKNGRHMLEIAIDHLQTPDKDFRHVRFVVDKLRKGPMTLQLDSFSCWPDCLDSWPECSWIDENFTASKKIIMPWVSIDAERWSSTYDHQCQFDSLSRNEKVLVSTLWAEFPNLLTMIKSTPRVQRNHDRWLPIIEFMQEQYSHPSVNLADTPYASFAQTIDISSDYARPEPGLKPLPEPLTSVVDIKSLIAVLSAEDLLLHDLLLPQISGDHVPELPLNDPKRPSRYLKAVVEHPLFQLK